MEIKNRPGTISFSIIHNDFKLKNRLLLKRKIASFITTKGYTTGDISYIFCDDLYLLEINSKYLKHNTLTDIITFDYNEKGKRISGDIFISIDRLRENAIKYKIPFDNELYRVISHGILHLMGFSDKSNLERVNMRTNEDEAIAFFVNYL